MNRFGIAFKINALNGLCMLAALLGALSLLARMHANSEHDRQDFTALLRQSDLAREMQVDFKKQVQEWKDILLRGDNPADFEKYSAQFFREEKLVQERGQKLCDLDITPETREQVRGFLRAHEGLGKRYRAALEVFASQGKSDYRAVDRLVRGIDRDPTDEIDKIVASMASQFEAYRASREAALVQEERYAALATAGLFLVLLVASVLIAKRYIRPLHLLTQATEQMAGGASDVVVRYDAKDELGRLAGAFNAMSSRIQSRDRSLRKEREILRESEQRFQQMAENIEQVFWMRTPGGEKLIYVSPAFETIWERTCASAYASPGVWTEAVLNEDRPAVLEAAKKNAAGENFDIEYRICRPGGAVRWIRERGFPVFDEAGCVTRVCGIAEDFTASKEAETAHRNTERQLRDASRLAGMAEVATSVLHNVGNVLNSVNTSLSVATEKVGGFKGASLGKAVKLLEEHAENLPAFLADHPQGSRLPWFLGQLAEHFVADQQTVLRELEFLRTNVEHINEIVAMQQTYATSGGLIEVLLLADLVEDALRMNTAAFERHGTRVVREFDASLPPIPVDRNKVLLILVNLIRNAKYACDDGQPEEKCITLRTELNGHGCVKISVSDNGIGIPPENLTHIFEHGFTTRKGGHGFGLHSSALAASAMGGFLRAQSAGTGCGATFTVELPLSPQQS